MPAPAGSVVLSSANVNINNQFHVSPGEAVAKSPSVSHLLPRRVGRRVTLLGGTCEPRCGCRADDIQFEDQALEFDTGFINGHAGVNSFRFQGIGRTLQCRVACPRL